MAPRRLPPSPSPVASGVATLDWTWILDEAAIREDGGAAGLAVGVDAAIARQYAYAPPDAAYEHVLSTATREPADSPSPPMQLAAGAGWISSPAPGPPPVFIAHTMLSAVWLLRESLPNDALTEAAWAQLAQAASCAALATPPAAPAPSPRVAAPARPAKRARTASATPTHAAPDAEDGGQDAVATVSRRNRRAPPAREAQPAPKGPRQREAARLADPGLQAPEVERNAHRSISPQDKPTVAWIVQQPAGLHDFFHTAKLPYATATTMLRCARAIGNETAIRHAACFVENWRASGHPLQAVTNTPSATISRSKFHVTMDAISYSEAVSALSGIFYRWAMAQLGQLYQEEIERIEAADRAAALAGNRTSGRGRVRSRAKKALWDKEQPRASWDAYNSRLKRSHRWWQAATVLGWGFLVLVPSTLITPNWVEQTLRTAEWDIWLQLVERVNPAALQAGRAFDAWAGPAALKDGSLQGAARLRLEQRLGSRIHEVAEADSDAHHGSQGDGDTDHDSDSGDSARGSAPSRAASPSPGSCEQAAGHTAVPRPLDLRELFRSVGSGDLALSSTEGR